MGRTLTQEEFLQRCYSKHGNRYDYSQTIYRGAHLFINVICKIHGVFFLKANAHTNGTGCSKCSGKYRKNTQDFIEEAMSIHGDRYDYSRVNYINSKTHVDITCNICNYSFPVVPNNHLKGSNCPRCFMPNCNKSRDEVITDCIQIYGDRYSYEKVVYSGVYKPFIIACPRHGEFSTDYSHFVIRKQGCIKCADRVCLSNEEFISRATKIHSDRYIYDKVVYVNNKTPVEIICRSHGSFLQTPNMHVSHSNGCPSCQRKSEGKVKEFLVRNFPDIEIIHDKVWEEVYGTRRPDFRIPSMNLILEYDGEQHFKQIEKRESPEHTQLIDTWKVLKALYNGYSIIRIHYSFLNRQNWESLLLPAIKSYGPSCIRYAGKYDIHKQLIEEWKDRLDELETLI